MRLATGNPRYPRWDAGSRPCKGAVAARVLPDHHLRPGAHGQWLSNTGERSFSAPIGVERSVRFVEHIASRYVAVAPAEFDRSSRVRLSLPSVFAGRARLRGSQAIPPAREYPRPRPAPAASAARPASFIVSRPANAPSVSACSRRRARRRPARRTAAASTPARPASRRFARGFDTFWNEPWRCLRTVVADTAARRSRCADASQGRHRSSFSIIVNASVQRARALLHRADRPHQAARAPTCSRVSTSSEHRSSQRVRGSILQPVHRARLPRCERTPCSLPAAQLRIVFSSNISPYWQSSPTRESAARFEVIHRRGRAAARVRLGTAISTVTATAGKSARDGVAAPEGCELLSQSLADLV